MLKLLDSYCNVLPALVFDWSLGIKCCTYNAAMRLPYERCSHWLSSGLIRVSYAIITFINNSLVVDSQKKTRYQTLLKVFPRIPDNFVSIFLWKFLH